MATHTQVPCAKEKIPATLREKLFQPETLSSNICVKEDTKRTFPAF